MARQILATPGVYTIERSSRVRIGMRGVTSILPPRCARNVRSEYSSTSTPGTLDIRWISFCAWSASAASTVMSRTMPLPSTRTMSSARMSPPTLPMAEVSWPSIPGRFTMRQRAVKAKLAEGCWITARPILT